MNKKKWLCMIIILLIIVVYGLGDYILPTKIEHVYDHAIGTKNTVFIILKHAPNNNKSMLSFWDKNKEFINKKYHIRPGHPKQTIIFLRNKYEKYNDDSDQFCFQRNNTERVCINNNQTLLLISKMPAGDIYFGLVQPMCAFMESPDQERSSWICPGRLG